MTTDDMPTRMCPLCTAPMVGRRSYDSGNRVVGFYLCFNCGFRSLPDNSVKNQRGRAANSDADAGWDLQKSNSLLSTIEENQLLRKRVIEQDKQIDMLERELIRYKTVFARLLAKKKNQV